MISWFTSLLSLNLGRPDVEDPRLTLSLATMPMLALDFELTGLNIENAHITSAGWVKGTAERIVPYTCFYSVVKTKQSLAQSPVIHGLTDTVLKAGCPITDVVKRLFPLLSTHILVCHHARLEIGLIQRLAARFGLSQMTLVVIDTMQMANYLLARQGAAVSQNALTLEHCRKRYKLPMAPTHDALSDAHACYELWLAQLSALNIDRNIPVTQLSHTGALTIKKIGKKRR